MIAEVDILLIYLVVILSIGSNRQVRIENDTAVLRTEEPRIGVAHGRVYPQAVEVGGADAGGNAVQLRLLPADWKRYGRAEQSVEIESIARVLSEIAHIHQNPSAQALLDAGIVLIAAAERDGPLFRRSLEQVARKTTRPRGTGDHEILGSRRFHSVAVATADDRLGGFEQVGERAARLQAITVREAVIAVEPHADVQRQVAQRDGILTEKSQLIDRGIAAEPIRLSSPAQVIWE